MTSPVHPDAGPGTPATGVRQGTWEWCCIACDLKAKHFCQLKGEAVSLVFFSGPPF